MAVLYTVHGGGHVVPQPAFRYPRMLGRTTGDLDAPSSALQFFGLSQWVSSGHARLRSHPG
jgi:polyhydroxybutyrate depolymerase